MSIWYSNVTIEDINKMSQNTMVQNLGIEMVEIGKDFLKASMPVDHRTVQPMRLLHGGASVALAETLGSVASVLVIDPSKTNGAVGIEINANHIKSALEGTQVYGIATPLSLGRSIHVWDIKIYNQVNELCVVCRLTTKVLKRRD